MELGDPGRNATAPATTSSGEDRHSFTSCDGRGNAVVARVTQAHDGDDRRIRLELDAGADTRIACTNPSCRGGGVALETLIRRLLRESGDGAMLLVEPCPGQRRSGRRDGGECACGNLFCVGIESSGRGD